MGVEPTLSYSGRRRGWPGDSPLIHLDCTRMRALGWAPTLTIREGIVAHARVVRREPIRVGGRDRIGGAGHMSVIFSRAPLRISLGGGGTDLPSYYREHGGFLVAGAIDKYIYMLMHTVFQRRYKMKYSQTEDVDEIACHQAPHPARDAQPPLAREPTRDSDGSRRPGGTGMGSSGAFTVTLLKGLADARRTSITQGVLAEDAWRSR